MGHCFADGWTAYTKKLVGTWTTKDPASPWDGMSEPIKFWSRMFFLKVVVMKRLKLKLKLMAILLIQKKILQKGCMPRPEEVSSVTPLISRTHAHTCTHTHTHKKITHTQTYTHAHAPTNTHPHTRASDKTRQKAVTPRTAKKKKIIPRCWK